MHVNSKRLPKLTRLAIIALAAACSSDRVATPLASSPDVALNVAAPAAPSAVMQLATPAAEINADAASDRFATMATVNGTNVVHYQFTVTPTQAQSFILGTHMVSFPANTICNPSTSGYGPSVWLSSCGKLTQPITIAATTWRDPQGRAQINFDTDIRFYPNSSGQLPAVYLRDPWAALSAFSRIDYCTSDSFSSCVNEALADETLKTRREAVTGYLFRLVRHFSGYNVWA